MSTKHPVFVAPEGFLSNSVTVQLIGCGGTGSQVLTALASMHHALCEMGHEGLDVTVWDDDIVEPFNVGRQPFYPQDIGSHKAAVLVNRVNMCYGTDWAAETRHFKADDSIRAQFGHVSLIIGCVDTKSSRREIHKFVTDQYRRTMWLDIGNMADTGQFVLGTIGQEDTAGILEPGTRLPVVTELFPEILDESIPEPDNVPSCSMRDALAKQSLFINREMANQAMALLWELFSKGQIKRQGAFIDLAGGRVTPMPIDTAFWSRMGIQLKAAEEATQLAA